MDKSEMKKNMNQSETAKHELIRNENMDQSEMASWTYQKWQNMNQSEMANMDQSETAKHGTIRNGKHGPIRKGKTLLLFESLLGLCDHILNNNNYHMVSHRFNYFLKIKNEMKTAKTQLGKYF